jgi:hypothetical protein
VLETDGEPPLHAVKVTDERSSADYADSDFASLAVRFQSARASFASHRCHLPVIAAGRVKRACRDYTAHCR